MEKEKNKNAEVKSPVDKEIKREILQALNLVGDVENINKELGITEEHPFKEIFDKINALNNDLQEYLKIHQQAHRQITTHSGKVSEQKSILETKAETLAQANAELNREMQERIRIEEQLKRRIKQSLLVYEVSQRISRYLQLDQLLVEIVRAIQESFNYYGVQLFLVNRKKNELQMKSAAGDTAAIFPQQFSIPVGKGMIGFAAQSLQTQLAGNVAEHPHYFVYDKEKTLSEISVPVISNQQVIGVIDIQSLQYHAFDDADKAMLEILSNHIAITIENASLYEQSQKEVRERKKAQKKILDAKNMAENARQVAEAANESKNMFLARMSHEFRTPLNSVIGFSDMLLDTSINDEQLEFIRNIIKSGESLMALINEVLDFSRIEAGKMTFHDVDFDPEVMAFNVCTLIQPRLEDRPIEVFCRIEDDVPALVNGDPGRFRQVLVNLMGNAAKFTSQGEIELSLAVEKEEPKRIKIHTTVRDTGIGIPEDKLVSIFEYFYQVDGSITRKYGGTGLGLAICQQIARLMNGDVWAESELGKGSIFHFTAWLAKSDKMSSLKPMLVDLKGKKALIVDDNRTNLRIITHFLKSVGMDSISVMAGELVMPTLESELEKNQSFDICIMDIQMPLITGYEVAQQIRRHPSDKINRLHIIACSSLMARRTRIFRECGFDGFLPKPVRKFKLLTMIQQILAEGELSEEKRRQEIVLTQHSLTDKAKHAIRILLVEDNLLNQKLAKIMLDKGGYQVKLADNGRQAIDMFLSDPVSFDLIFMDIQMPEMDGIMTTMNIRKKGYKDIPIIAMTADASKEDKERCLASGMNDFMAKPIKREMVYAMIQKWIFNE